MNKKLEDSIKINKDICNFCLFYEEDYMPTEMGNVHLEWCHYNNGFYSPKTKKQIMSFEIHDCDGFKEEVKFYLNKLEQKYNITILYAVESGSRAWGFFNEKSDFDIRFIYKHNDLKEYLHVNNKYEEVMIFKDGVYDIVGWDIKKALWLHSKSNPSLYEWLNTDYIYINRYPNLFEGLPVMDTKSLLHHYYNMGNNHWVRYCVNWRTNEDIIVLSKKFLYVVRCILSWNLLFNDIKPNMNIHVLSGQNMSNEFIDESIGKSLKSLTDLYSYYASESILSSLKEEYYYIFKNMEEWIVNSLEIMKENTSKYKFEPNKFSNEYNDLFFELVSKKEDYNL